MVTYGSIMTGFMRLSLLPGPRARCRSDLDDMHGEAAVIATFAGLEAALDEWKGA